MADTAATFAGIHNENELCSQHYLFEIFTGDIRSTIARWRDAAEEAGGPSAGARTPNEALRAVARDYLRFRRQFGHERQHARRVARQEGAAGAELRGAEPTAEPGLIWRLRGDFDPRAAPRRFVAGRDSSRALPPCPPRVG